MLRVLNRNGTVIDKISGYSDYHIKTVLNQYDRTMTFRIPYRLIENIIENEGYIETKDDRFVIQSVKPDSTGMCEVTAVLDLEALEGKALLSFDSTEQTVDTCLRLAIAGTGWTVGTCDVTKRRTVRATMKSALDVIRQAESVYRCYIIPNAKSKKLNIYAQYGSDKGVYFKTGLNVVSLSVEKKSTGFFTEIEPYGKDGMTIESVNDGQIYLSNHQYSDKVKRCIWKDERYTVAASLKEDAAAKLADMSKPYVAYSASVRDLAKQSDAYGILAYALGDIVTLIDDETGTREEQRIVELDQYPEEPSRDSCTIANKVMTFDEMAQRYQSAADTVSNVTSDDGTLDGSKVDAIESRQIVDLENTVVHYAAITTLQTEMLTVSGNLDAATARIGTLEANVGDFEELTTQRLDAAEANIGTLQTTALTADSAVIHTLQSDYADIANLLAGNVGTGSLQAIVLNSSNASIDTALIRNILSNNITVNDLLAGRISTDRFSIGSDNGGMLFTGNTAQWTDTAGNVRIQIGRDAQQNFSFLLADANGNPLWYENGITADGIPEGLIVDSKVAANAGIQASKLDIQSLFNAINSNGTYTISGSRIYVDEAGQSLGAVFTQMTQDIDSAEGEAAAATAAAQRAIEAISGIDVLSTMAMSLSNDAHVVHTEIDGSGGDYTDCWAIVTVYLGDTNISSSAVITTEASEGITGSYNASTRKYQVTDMSTDDGYVDFDALYGTERRPMATRTGTVLTTRGGNRLTVRAGGLHLQKRFSVSKAKDGKIGKSYRIASNIDVIKKNLDGETFAPAQIVFTATYNTGTAIVPYLGIFVIEESADGSTYTEMYRSATGESSKTYVPTDYDLRAVRCRLLDSAGSTEYDAKTVLMLLDAESLNVQVSTIRSDVTAYKADMDQLSAEFATVKTDYYGTKAGSVILQTPYTISGNDITFTAKVYRSGEDVTNAFPAEAFQWYTRTEDGDVYLGTGYTKTTDRSQMGYGGVMICRMYITEERYLAKRDGTILTTRGGVKLTARVA